MRDRERVDVGIVVALDDDEIIGHQEGRSAGAAWKEQNGLSFGRERAAVDPPQPEQAPVGEGAAALAKIESCRHRDLEALGQAGLPAGLLQIIRDRGQHIGTIVQMSRRPSPEKSTAWFMKLDGMNCGWPMAPAHDPSMAFRAIWPSCRISSA